MLTSVKLRELYVKFFESKGHAVIPAASLIPDNDPTALFTTAGMHPLVPYLLGEPHPLGKRLVDVQKCVRTTDIEEIGDTTHHTCFEMLGNWSLGDYFKQDAITWSFEFLTGSEWLGLPIGKLAVTIFEGDSEIPKDEESASIWLGLGIPAHKVTPMSKKDNFWGPAGMTGPCGPSTEMYYWIGEGTPPLESNPRDDESNWVEIWNDVFMEYFKQEDGSFQLMDQKNVDTGMGLERVVSVLNGYFDNYRGDSLYPLITLLDGLTGTTYLTDTPAIVRAKRIIADHIKAATFIIGDENGVTPSNKDQGYILRRLIRRAIMQAYVHLNLTQDTKTMTQVATKCIEMFGSLYPEIGKKKDQIVREIAGEEERFGDTLVRGKEALEKSLTDIQTALTTLSQDPNLYNSSSYKTLSSSLSESEPLTKLMSIINPLLAQAGQERLLKNGETDDAERLRREKLTELLAPNIAEVESLVSLLQKDIRLSAKTTFHAFHTYGFPLDLTKEIANSYGILVDEDGFHEEFRKHQDLSRQGSEEKFKGGLQDHSDISKRYHTATHLLHKALRMVLGEHVFQKGSNITHDRMRFDFSHTDKMTPEELKQVEDIVNEQVRRELPVSWQEMGFDDAKNKGALGLFEHKYGDLIKVYTVGDFSCEVCGGPHVENTREIGKFTISKEEASSAGVRRIKAAVE